MSNTKFDLIQLTIGYNTYIVPEKAAFAIFELLRGADIYKLDSKYENGNSTYFARHLTQDECPSIRVLGPVQFHTMREAHKMLMEAEEAKAAARK